MLRKAFCDAIYHVNNKYIVIYHTAQAYIGAQCSMPPRFKWLTDCNKTNTVNESLESEGDFSFITVWFIVLLAHYDTANVKSFPNSRKVETPQLVWTSHWR